MINENNIVDLFPTPLYVATDVLTEEENQELIDHIISTQDKQVGRGKELWHSGIGSPKNSFGLDIKEYPKSWFKNAKISKIFDVNLNRFKVVSGLSREHWIEKGWIFKEDPLGWFQWYCRFTNGRRIAHMDIIQIKRWKNFKRHVLAIEKNCEKGDLGCRKRQRQAILQWAYNPYR